MRVDSQSLGDPERFRALQDLERGLESLRSAPRDDGRVTLVVRRVSGGVRETPLRVRLAPETGIPGDTWERQQDRDPEKQIAVMQADVADLIANGQPLTLFGDGLFLELDLSRENLPEGSRLRLGSAVLQVTPQPHNGCQKFMGRFGSDALRFVSKPELRHRNLRGIYLRVAEPGEVGPGDPVNVLTRASGPRRRAPERL